MEAAYCIIENVQHRTYLQDTLIESAAAIDKQNKWVIEGAKNYADTGDIKSLKIKMNPLN